MLQNAPADAQVRRCSVDWCAFFSVVSRLIFPSDMDHVPACFQVWDVLGLTLKTCRACNVPPAVNGAPGKALMMEVYKLYCDVKTKEKGAPPKQDDLTKRQG